MPSSKAILLAALGLAGSCWASRAGAQQAAPGFAVERLYSSAPGGGWIVMDALDMRGGLGGGAQASLGYSQNPLQVGTTDGAQHAAVVADRAFADFAFAGTYDRWRFSLAFDMPLSVHGQSGVVGAYRFAGPSLGVGSNPDTLADARVGVDVRLLGEANSRFRLGAGVQLFVPSGERADYVSDGTYRAMGRALFAGDEGAFTYAGHLGVHVRPLDDSPTPGSPRGSELLFGLAGGAKIAYGDCAGTALIIGPEIYGATAFRSFFDENATAVEGLLSGRLEGTADDGPQSRIKLGVGTGLDKHFGAPDWRLVFAIEIFDHHVDADGDGVSDAKDACPHEPGVRTTDPRTNGCPTPP